MTNTVKCVGHRNSLGEKMYCGGCDTLDPERQVGDPVKFTDQDGVTVVGRVFERFPQTGTVATVVTATGMCRSVPKGTALADAPRYQVVLAAEGNPAAELDGFLFNIWDHRLGRVERRNLTAGLVRAAYCELAGIRLADFGCRWHLGEDRTCGNCV